MNWSLMFTKFFQSLFKSVDTTKIELICETKESFNERKPFGSVLVMFGDTIDLVTALKDVMTIRLSKAFPSSGIFEIFFCFYFRHLRQ